MVYTGKEASLWFSEAAVAIIAVVDFNKEMDIEIIDIFPWRPFQSNAEAVLSKSVNTLFSQWSLLEDL